MPSTAPDDGVMSPLDQYHHDLLFAADRIARAVRTENLDAISAEIETALAAPVPDGGPDPVRAVIVALAVQIDPDTAPLRKRMAWTLDINAVNEVPRPTRGLVA
jgi:hypothetical protein